MNPPPRLFKYESVTTQSLQNLKTQTIFFGSPLNFNDPYDCALSPSIKEPSDDDVEKIRQSELASKTLDPRAKDTIRVASTSGLRAMYLRIGQSAAEQAIQDFLAQKGVSCFSETNDNLLMWAHYGGHSRGFCLEFDATHDPFSTFKKVGYASVMPSLDLVKLVCKKNYDQILDLYCTKSKDWEYEREWRGIHNKVGTAYTYPGESLTGIYFGPEVAPSVFEIVCLILNGQNETVKFWRGTRSKANFAVEYEQVLYTPHLAAKRKGLL